MWTCSVSEMRISLAGSDLEMKMYTKMMFPQEQKDFSLVMFLVHPWSGIRFEVFGEWDSAGLGKYCGRSHSCVSVAKR